MNIEQVKLPANTHAVVLTARDVVDGEDLHRVVVWADRIITNCGLCGLPCGREVDECPVILNAGAGQGGALETVSQQHGCGEWLCVDWAEVTPSPIPAADPDDEVAPGVTAAAVIAEARRLADQRTEEARAQAATITSDLRRDLTLALARLAEPYADDETEDDRHDEVSTGSVYEPGVYLGDDGWQAWEYDPATDGETITVYAENLVESRT